MYVKTGDIKIGETFSTYRFNNLIIHNKHLKGPSSELSKFHIESLNTAF